MVMGVVMRQSLYLYICCNVSFIGLIPGVEGARLVPWVGGPPDASFGFYLREAFQSHTDTEKILYNNSG